MQQNLSQSVKRQSLSEPILQLLIETKQRKFDNEKIEQKFPIIMSDNQYCNALPIIKKTWKELMRNQNEVGQSIYDHVLRKDISMSRLFINAKIDKQSISFMQMLDTIIGYLDNRKTMDKKLKELGRIHNIRYGVKPQHYKHFRVAFMKAITNFIPWNIRREQAWLWFWGHIISIMSSNDDDDNETPTLSFNLPTEKNIEYISVIHDSLGNGIDSSPFEFIKQFYVSLLSEQFEISKIISPIMELKSENARFISMLQHTIKLLDDQSAFQKKIIELILRYHNFYNINANQFEEIMKIFIRILKQFNAKQWKPIHDEAWQWFSQIIIELFTTSLQQ